MPDFDEIVFCPGVGHLTLRTAVRRIMEQPPEPGKPRLTSLFRDVGCEPSIYDYDNVLDFAATLDSERFTPPPA